jgi:hypothetical protein
MKGELVDLTPIVAEELVREFRVYQASHRRTTPRFGRMEQLIARGEDLFVVAVALHSHESRFGRLHIDPNGWIQIECRPKPIFMQRERLADPRCFSRLIASIEHAVDRWISSLYHDFESTTDPFEIQRLTALKAFFLAFEASQRGQRAQLVKNLDEIVELLEIEEPERPSTIRHQALYRLALATCLLHDHGQVVKAGQYGLKFRQFGSFSPIHPWRKIIDAVCRAAREHKIIRRRRQRLRLPYGHNEKEAECLRSAAGWAAELSKPTLDKFGPFLQGGTLEDLARYHRIY